MEKSSKFLSFNGKVIFYPVPLFVRDPAEKKLDGLSRLWHNVPVRFYFPLEKKGVSMYRFKKILVGLGNNEHDVVVLRYAGWLSRMAKSKKMILFHAIERPDTSSCLPSEYAECFEPPDPLSREKMEGLARKSLNGYPEMVQECLVVKGDPFGEIIQKVR